MLAKRIIPCLDVAGGRVVKGVHFLDLRDAGDPVELGKRYYLEGADELVFLDITATVEERKTVIDWVRKIADNVFVPFTVGGGIRSLEQIQDLLRAGADKVSINSAAVRDPELIRQAASRFGSQCIVLAVDVKRVEGRWKVFTGGGRHETEWEALEWIRRGQELGAGEILLTSMDRDGTQDGYDLELLRRVTGFLTIPVIASGGAGSLKHLLQAFQEGGADAVLAASIFHYGCYTIGQAKEFLRAQGVEIRLTQTPVGGTPAGTVQTKGGSQLDSLAWEKMDDLIPAIVQDGESGRVLMCAYLNRDALETTLKSGQVTFWSRSRGRLWTKGESSGNYLRLVSANADCDGDCILLKARPEGPVCHRGTLSCFEEDQGFTGPEFLIRLERLIRSRKSELPEGSYTTRLFQEGLPKIAQKLGEEAVELVVSAMQDKERSISEAADLLYHLLVFLVEREVALGAVVEELAQRHSADSPEPAK